MTVVEFLTARLDEDEAVARRLADHWADNDSWAPADLVNVGALVDPARVLREVEAKRLLIELAVRTQEALDEEWGRTPSTPPELRILAAVYADHPDYDEEWKP